MWDKWWQGPHQIRLVFLAVMVLLAATLGYVAWWLVVQDQQLVAQRLGERQDAAADLAVASLEKKLSGIEEQFKNMKEKEIAPRDGSVYVFFLPGAIRPVPDNRLIYSPDVREIPEVSNSLFETADALEFQKGDFNGALAALRQPAESADARTRAAALARMARNYRKANRPQEALKSAEQLSQLDAVEISGIPAALAGRLSRLYVFEQQKDRDSLISAAQEFVVLLNSGHWKLSPAAYASLSKEVSRFPGDMEKLPTSARRSVAEGVEWLWDRWNRDRGAMATGRQTLTTPSGSVLLLWNASANSAVGYAMASEQLQSQWLWEIAPRLDNLHIQLVLTDAEGRSVLGKPLAAGHPSIKLAHETGLPWTIQTFSTSDAAAEFASRRKLLIAGMTVLLILLLTGTWFISHAVSRELELARLKTDFVSTVSHEFRTPLTTLCQLSELLKRDRVSGEDDRRQYYELLHTESNRLRRLVEALLNFGRLEAGKLQFHFEKVDAAAFVRQSAQEFIEAQQAQGHRLEIETPDAPQVQADRETLKCVFWNLFENAVKYSPGCDTVWINLSRKGANVEIEVRDRGVGIPRGEHRRIFEKFVRGEAAKESNIRGTGIGLAMARQIVRAHGGDIIIESELGKGSTFRVVLPEAQGNA